MLIKSIDISELKTQTFILIDNKQAAIVDPILDITLYSDYIKKHDLELKYILRTQNHYTFLEGYKLLQNKYNAKLISPKHLSEKEKEALNQENFFLPLGEASIEVLATKGPTAHNISFVARDKDNAISGLFIGDFMDNTYGKPMIFEKDVEKETLAAWYYESLQYLKEKLPDNTTLYSLREKEKQTTLKNKFHKQSVFSISKKENFIQEIVKDIEDKSDKEVYLFEKNLEGSIIEDSSKNEKTYKALSLNDFIKDKTNCQILDIRNPEKFAKGFIPASLNIDINEAFSLWAFEILDYRKNLIIVGEDQNQINTAIKNLNLIGFQNIIGYFENGFEKWRDGKRPIDMVIEIDAEEMAMDYKFDTNILLLDVRSIEDFDINHIHGSQHIPLKHLANPLYMAAVDEEAHTYVYADNASKSMTACSLLKKEGFFDVRNIIDPYHSIKEHENFVLMTSKAYEEGDN